MSDFDKLLAELNTQAEEQNTMAKALPADDGSDDEKVLAAAAEGGDMEEGEGLEDDEDDENEDEEGEVPFGKSYNVTTDDGQTLEAVDGTELVKSLMNEVSVLKTGFSQGEAKMAKALEGCVNLIKQQGDMIKSLTASHNKLAGTGRGRKAMLNINEKPAAGEQLQKSHSEGIAANDFMAKSHAAFDAKKITGLELTTIDVSLRNNTPIDPSVIQKVLS